MCLPLPTAGRNAPGKARELRPIGAELKFHGDAGDNTQHEVDAEDLRPEAHRLVVRFVASPDGERLEHDDQRRQAHRQLRKQIMKSDGEGKMNTVEKQCVVHVCSRPAIVGSSQSVTLLSRSFLLDFRTVTQFIHISRARDIVKRFSSGTLRWSAIRTIVFTSDSVSGQTIRQSHLRYGLNAAYGDHVRIRKTRISWNRARVTGKPEAMP